MKNENEASRSTVIAILNTASQLERDILLNWAQQMLMIRESNLPPKQKITRSVEVTKELGATGPVFQHFWKMFINLVWSDRSGPMKGLIGGAGIGLVATLAGPMAGVAAFGGAIAVPVIVLGAGGGTLLMTIIEELTRSK